MKGHLIVIEKEFLLFYAFGQPDKKYYNFKKIVMLKNIRIFIQCQENSWANSEVFITD